VGFEQAHLRERVRQDLRIAAYLDQRFSVVPPTDEEVEAVYRGSPGRFTRAGAPVPLDEVRVLIVREIVWQRRAPQVEAWVETLRRRSQIVNLYGTPGPAGGASVSGSRIAGPAGPD
jgi:hypothetical protein